MVTTGDLVFDARQLGLESIGVGQVRWPRGGKCSRGPGGDGPLLAPVKDIEVVARGGSQRIGRVLLEEERQLVARHRKIVEGNRCDRGDIVRVAHARMLHGVYSPHGFNGLTILMAAMLGIGQSREDIGIGGTDNGGLVKLRCGKRVIVLREGKAPKIQECTGKLGIQSYGGLEFTLSPRLVVLVKISHPQVVVGGNEFGIDSDGFLQMPNCIAGMLSPQQGTCLVEFVDGFCGRG